MEQLGCQSLKERFFRDTLYVFFLTRFLRKMNYDGCHYDFEYGFHLHPIYFHNNFPVEIFTCQARQLLSPDREGGMVSSPNLKITDFHPGVPWRGVVLQHLINKKKSLIISFHSPWSSLVNLVYKLQQSSNPPTCLALCSAPSSLFNHHLRSVGTVSIPSPIHP